MHLIVSAAAASTDGDRPPWLRLHPTGNLAIVESIQGLDLRNVAEVIIICLKRHTEQYDAVNALRKQFLKLALVDKLRIVSLSEPASLPSAVYQCLSAEDIRGAIAVKDWTNHFEATILVGNTVYYVPVGERAPGGNQSCISLTDQSIVYGIGSHKGGHDEFYPCGYGFEDAGDFVASYKQCDPAPTHMSDIIRSALLSGVTFRGEPVARFTAWGTRNDWRAYQRAFCTLFVDLDGTLVTTSSEFFTPRWGETGGIIDNIRVINELYASGVVRIIITTSRTKEYAAVTEAQLERLGIRYHDILYDLLHARRIVINDYSAGNPYRSCEAVNIRRDSDSLRELLADLTPLLNDTP